MGCLYCDWLLLKFIRILKNNVFDENLVKRNDQILYIAYHVPDVEFQILLYK